MGASGATRPDERGARLVLRATTRSGPRGAARRGGRSDGRDRAISFVRMSIGGESLDGRHAAPGRDRPRLPRPRHLRRARGGERAARRRARCPPAAHRPERRLGPGLPRAARLAAAAAAARLGPRRSSACADRAAGGRALRAGPPRSAGWRRPRAARRRLARLALRRGPGRLHTARGRGLRGRRPARPARRRRRRRGRSARRRAPRRPGPAR